MSETEVVNALDFSFNSQNFYKTYLKKRLGVMFAVPTQ